MEWFWKPLGAPLLVAAIVGIAAFYFGRATATDVPLIRGEVRSVRIPNPVYKGRPGIGAEIEKALAPVPKIAGMSNLIDEVRFEPSLRIFSVTLRNDSAVRTKEI